MHAGLAVNLTAQRGRSARKSCRLPSRARVEHGDRPPVLRPAGNIVAYRDRTFLAVGDRAHPVGIDAACGEIIMHGLGAPGAERDIVFPGSALVGMALDGEAVAIV